MEFNMQQHKDDKQPHSEAQLYLIFMFVLQIISFMLDATKFINNPWRYFSRVSNIVDFLNLSFGFANIGIQYFLGGNELYQKIVFLILVATTLAKYFNFLRAIRALSYLIFMLEHVTMKLLPFFLFYMILILMIGLMMSIAESNIVQQNKRHPELDNLAERIINSLRLTQGAVTEGQKGVNEIPLGEINLFFVVRILSLVISNMIFMTFIVGTIMTTFNSLRPMIDILIERQRVILIRDAHDIFGRQTSDTNWFPQFLVIREQET